MVPGATVWPEPREVRHGWHDQRLRGPKGALWPSAVHGVVALDLATGRVQAITAKAVVLCTGGRGKVFPFTTNANINTGDGMALSYRAGAPLKDKEFVQYHPTGLPFTGILTAAAPLLRRCGARCRRFRVRLVDRRIRVTRAR